MQSRFFLLPALASLSFSAAAQVIEPAAGEDTAPAGDFLQTTAVEASPQDPNAPAATVEPPSQGGEAEDSRIADAGEATQVAGEAPARDSQAPIEDTDAGSGEPIPVAEIPVDSTDESDTIPVAAATDAAVEDTTEPAAAEAASPTAAEPEPSAEPAMTMADVIALLQAQQKQIDQQKTLLDSQAQQIATLTRELDTLRAPAPTVTLKEEIVAKADTDSLPIDTQAPETEVQEVAEVTATEQANEEAKAAKEETKAVARAQTDDPTRALLEDFVGAWRLPGTSAALAIGGFVKANFVWNWDPLEISDRFIVGSIPVGVSGGVEEETSMTANQSRINFDLREPTEFGLLRAFIEGDFAEEGDTFRLRHAFGQWKAMTAGKTWSAFVDTQASPEEVDFEGLNGRINVRQSQVRLAPKLGEQYEFQLSMEDPNPQVSNGSGVTRAPDIVMTGRFEPYDKLHTKIAMLVRQIRAQPDSSIGGGVEKQWAWGLSVSGRYSMPYWDDRDSLLFQLNGGDGIGRYVNDLSSVGNFDGIFDRRNGNLELFDIYSGYVSFQHWWGRNQLRSNFTLGFVDVNNPGFVDPNAYKSTIRASSNLFWSPTPRIDIGGEYLWGKRENENGNNADATQLQLAVRYRF